MKSETGRGFKEARDQIEVLRARWPKAFPLAAHQVRPLETATLDIIVNEMGWTRPYARAVLAVWKKRTAYCRAILAYPTRFRLDGSPTDEIVDDIARNHAQLDLARNQQRKLAREASATDPKAAGKDAQSAPLVAESPANKEEPAVVERPKVACPSQLIEALDLALEQDRIRFRLRVFRHFERMAPEALLDQAFEITGERLPRSAPPAAVCKAIAKFWIASRR